MVVALLLIPVWFYLGVRLSLPWTWYLAVPACIWVAGFILVDRMRHKRKPTEPGEPLLHGARESLAQVEHQIWLLRNVFWWYLLPFAISISAFFAHVTWQVSHDWLGAVPARGIIRLSVRLVLLSSIYLNQLAVRSQLEPRRQELLALLTGLGDESTEQFAAMRSARERRKPREAQATADSGRFLPRGAGGD